MIIQNRCTGRTMRTVLNAIVATSEAKAGQRVYLVCYNLRYCSTLRHQIRNVLSTYLRTLEGVDKLYSSSNTEERCFVMPWGAELCLIAASSNAMRDAKAKKNIVHKAYVDNTVTGAIEMGDTSHFTFDINPQDIGKNYELQL